MSIVPDKIHDELLNWSRWCWSGNWPHPLPKTRCGSAEGDYTSPPYWEPFGKEEVPDPPRIKPNARNAERVQAVWERWPVASPARQVLKAEYPGRDASGRREFGRDVAARRLNMTIRQYETALAWAAKEVGEAFALRA